MKLALSAHASATGDLMLALCGPSGTLAGGPGALEQMLFPTSRAGLVRPLAALAGTDDRCAEPRLTAPACVRAVHDLTEVVRRLPIRRGAALRVVLHQDLRPVPLALRHHAQVEPGIQEFRRREPPQRQDRAIEDLDCTTSR